MRQTLYSFATKTPGVWFNDIEVQIPKTENWRIISVTVADLTNQACIVTIEYNRRELAWMNFTMQSHAFVYDSIVPGGGVLRVRSLMTLSTYFSGISMLVERITVGKG